MDNPSDVNAIDYARLTANYGAVNESFNEKGQKQVNIGQFANIAQAGGVEETISANSASSVFHYDGTSNCVAPRRTTNTPPSIPSSVLSSVPTDFSPLIGKNMKRQQNYSQLLATGGNFYKEGLQYKVQIGAYRKPNKWRANYSRKFGEAEENLYGDNVFRFTLGVFDTMNDAEAYRQQVLGTFDDAWITGFFYGERVVLEDLVMRNFYQ